MMHNLTMNRVSVGRNETFFQCINASLNALDSDHISYTSYESSSDYFQELLISNNGLAIFTLVGFFAGFVFIIPGLAGIIWYEKYGNHRIR